jgi:hypothetical protein
VKRNERKNPLISLEKRKDSFGSLAFEMDESPRGIRRGSRKKELQVALKQARLQEKDIAMKVNELNEAIIWVEEELYDFEQVKNNNKQLKQQIEMLRNDLKIMTLGAAQACEQNEKLKEEIKYIEEKLNSREEERIMNTEESIVRNVITKHRKELEEEERYKLCKKLSSNAQTLLDSDDDGESSTTTESTQTAEEKATSDPMLVCRNKYPLMY